MGTTVWIMAKRDRLRRMLYQVMPNNSTVRPHLFHRHILQLRQEGNDVSNRLRFGITSLIAVGCFIAFSAPLAHGAALTAETATTTASAGSTAPQSNCPNQVVITLGKIIVSGGTVTVTFTHTGADCPSASPAVLRVHENLLPTRAAGRDPLHHLNQDFSVGPNFGNSVQVPLLDGIVGECFVQIDVHVGDQRAGIFAIVPTVSCPTSTPPPSSTAINPPPPSSTAINPPPPSSSAINPPPPPSSSAINPPPPASTTPRVAITYPPVHVATGLDGARRTLPWLRLLGGLALIAGLTLLFHSRKTRGSTSNRAD
jgi:hypothetical protein